MMNILLTIVLLVLGTLILSSLRKDPDENKDSSKPDQSTSTSSELDKPQPVDQPDPFPKNDAPSEEKSNQDQSHSQKEVEPSQPDPVEEKQVEKSPEVPMKKEPNVFSKIILYGPNNSFKTQLYYSLLLDQNPLNFQTVTSISPNISETFKFNGKKTTLVDIPGHSNFESKIGKYFEKNTLLLFVLKMGSEEHNYLGKTAHKLYEVLTKEDLRAKEVSLGLIIVRDSREEEKDAEEQFVKELEKEIERIKFSRRTHVNAEEGAGGRADYLKDIRDNFVLGHIRAKECKCLFMRLGKDSLKDLINLI